MKQSILGVALANQVVDGRTTPDHDGTVWPNNDAPTTRGSVNHLVGRAWHYSAKRVRKGFVMSEIRAVNRSTGLPPKPRETPKRDDVERPRPSRAAADCRSRYAGSRVAHAERQRLNSPLAWA
jgi:hypothetical protein